MLMTSKFDTGTKQPLARSTFSKAGKLLEMSIEPLKKRLTGDLCQKGLRLWSHTQAVLINNDLRQPVYGTTLEVLFVLGNLGLYCQHLKQGQNATLNVQ